MCRPACVFSGPCRRALALGADRSHSPTASRRRREMRLPTSAEWIFALKIFGAAMLALYLALWLDLPRPYWAMATVFITTQRLSGATRSKAAYRLAGTAVGASFTVFIVPILVNSPELLSLALTFWLGLCLYLSLLDRTPRSYAFMLSGYTAALIAFPSV